jgi:hypothetical protein
MSADIGAAREDSGGRGNWAICCSGGGVRSAMYCLGGLQGLDQVGLLGKVRWIVGVSGGSYIAASRALVAQGLKQRQTDDRDAYAPGTAEEQKLRENIGPDIKMRLAGVLLIPFGGAVTFIIAIAPLYVVSHALGWLLRWQHVLTYSAGRASASVTALSWWLVPLIAADITIVLFVYWWAATNSSTDSDSTARARWVGRAAAITTVLVLAMLAAPPLISWLYNTTEVDVTFGQVYEVRTRLSPAVLAGLVALVTVVAWFSARQLGKVASQPGVAGKAPGLLVLVARWARGPLKDWLGMLPPWVAAATTAVLGAVLLLVTFATEVAALLVVVIGAYAVLLWTADGARAGFTGAQLFPVLIALGIVLSMRTLFDVNRIPVQGFYRSALARAYAITRESATATDPVRRRYLLGAAARTRLTDLKSDPQGQNLVIGATVLVNANREVSPTRSPSCLAFDPDNVTLRGRYGCEKNEVAAKTADYEHLMGTARFTLFDVVSVTGGFSPLMGALARGASRMLFTVTNLRSGVWLPHPDVVRRARAHLDSRPDDSWWTKSPLLLLLWYVGPHPFWHRNPDWRTKAENREARLWAHVLKLREDGKKRGAVWYRLLQPTLGILWAEAVGQASYRKTWIHVTDGAHYDDLGLVEALKRGAQNIVVLDASGDRSNTWFALGDAMALARVDAGIEIALDPTGMVRTSGDGRALDGDGGAPRLIDGQVIRPWAHGTFERTDHRPDQAQSQLGNIWVCKLGWWAEAPWDIRAYAMSDSGYPCGIRRHQTYNSKEFEAYRELGDLTIGHMSTHGRFPLDTKDASAS